MEINCPAGTSLVCLSTLLPWTHSGICDLDSIIFRLSDVAINKPAPAQKIRVHTMYCALPLQSILLNRLSMSITTFQDLEEVHLDLDNGVERGTFEASFF